MSEHDVLDDTAAVLPFPAHTPHAPYYAVIFSSLRTDGDNGYGAMAERMVELARTMPGFLGIESVRDEEALTQGRPGITVSYWSSLEAIHEWKNQAEHRVAPAARARAVVCRIPPAHLQNRVRLRVRALTGSGAPPGTRKPAGWRVLFWAGPARAGQVNACASRPR